MFKIFFVIVVLQLTFFSCSSKKEEKAKILQQAEKVVNEYPDLLVTLENGDRLSTKSLEGKNVFVLFQPECDHCQEEAIGIEQRLDDFKDYTLYFISSSPMPQIMKFAEDYKLDHKKNVKFAWTTNEGVLNHYGPIPTPSVYIYAEGKLLKSFNGLTDVENIVNGL